MKLAVILLSRSRALFTSSTCFSKASTSSLTRGVFLGWSVLMLLTFSGVAGEPSIAAFTAVSNDQRLCRVNDPGVLSR